jgi:hypothetical protein
MAQGKPVIKHAVQLEKHAAAIENYMYSTMNQEEKLK